MAAMLGVWLRGGLRLLPWLLLLGGLALSGWWRYYLAPRHMPYLYAGLVVLALVLLLSELDGYLARRARLRLALASRIPLPTPPRAASLPDWLEAAVHWLPLTILLVLGPTTLTLRGGAPSSQQLFRLRGAAATQQLVDEPVPPMPQPAQAAADSAADATEAEPAVDALEPAPDPQIARMREEVAAAERELEALKQRIDEKAKEEAKEQQHISAQEAAARLRRAQAAAQNQPGPAPATDDGGPIQNYAQTDLVRLFMGRGGPIGNPVELVGRLHKVVGDDPVVPLGVDPSKVELVLYRYAIFCCVADAVPATAILEGLDPAQVKDEQWVRLRGRFHQTGATGDIPLLKVDSFEPISEPREPYLFTDPGDF
jgi:hypothetical protein